MGFLVRLVVNAAALWVAAQLVPGIVVTGAKSGKRIGGRMALFA